MIKRLSKAEPNLSIERVCSLLEVPVSSFYYKPVVNQESEIITEKIIEIHHDNLKCYGKRRMQKELMIQGIKIGVYKISSLMKHAGIYAKTPKKRHYYDVDEARPDIPNLLNRQFNQPKLNTYWCSGITYIRTAKDWSYLATILDLANKEIVGYATSERADTQLVINALTSAILTYKPQLNGLIFHADQGTQYISRVLGTHLKDKGIIQSMI
ncbi:IS3 family transposase [Thorsellia anophelis]|uniref:HTH-like domain-containing protein n=1 Tax=Thorsellia anophelis DSM 18579 TaxID=1123402 RepID=A0A1I0BT43_9GAMM|nr:IS3 family transposase [Thorsellia anophelis]SET09905.1 HTH-like domain-containing protein [Thorsellia anophelis DSM 18579]